MWFDNGAYNPIVETNAEPSKSYSLDMASTNRMQIQSFTVENVHFLVEGDSLHWQLLKFENAVIGMSK